MKKMSPSNPASHRSPPGGKPRPLLWIVAGCAALLVVIFLLPRPKPTASAPETTAASQAAGESSGAGRAATPVRDRDVASLLRSRPGSSGGPSPEVMVADKMSAFARDRRGLIEEMARRFQVQVSPEVGQFFDAAESGQWDDIKSLFNTLSAAKEGGAEGARDLEALWPAIKETYGAAAMAKAWPSQELLNYGNAILSSLRPGMVYVAGSDAARYIPTLLAETSGGDRPIILPQNSFAEGNQLDYLSFLHGDRLAGITREDAQKAFSEFLEEKQRGATGDAAPGEASAALRRSGAVAMSGVNEKLLALLMEKNPGVSFALEESVPMEGLLAHATPLGPVFELRGGGSQAEVNPTQAGQSLDYWRETAQRLQADSSLPPESPSRASYAQMVAAQAAYFANHNLTAEAEQAYRLGVEIAPASVDAVSQLSRYLVGTGRPNEAIEVVDQFTQQNPDLRSMAEDLRKSLQPAPDLVP